MGNPYSSTCNMVSCCILCEKLVEKTLQLFMAPRWHCIAWRRWERCWGDDGRCTNDPSLLIEKWWIGFHMVRKVVSFLLTMFAMSWLSILVCLKNKSFPSYNTYFRFPVLACILILIRSYQYHRFVNSSWYYVSRGFYNFLHLSGHFFNLNYL